MDSNLLLAILAMDSYNRSFGAAFQNGAVGDRLANATIRKVALPNGWEDRRRFAI